MGQSEGSPKIYTRTGDKGKTSLIGGTRVVKSHIRLDAYGTLDELNSWIGLLISECRNEGQPQSTSIQAELQKLTQFLTEIQNDLFSVGSYLACEDDQLRQRLPNVNEDRVTALEKEMDRHSLVLKPLKNFILPGGTRTIGFTHLARTVCRRAERLCVAFEGHGESEVETIVLKYMNRLSDYLFVLARYLHHLFEIEETIWGAKKSQ